MCVLAEYVGDGIEQIEQHLLAGGNPGAGRVALQPGDLPEVNHFYPGLYARELWRPAGTFIIGHKHKTVHECRLLKGRLNVFADGKVTHRKAGDVWIASAGGRKATYCPLDCEEGATLITYHPTTTTDLEALEEELIEKSPAFQAHELALMEAQTKALK